MFKAQGGALDLLKTLPTGKGPREVAITPDGGRAYVSNKDDNSLTVVDLAALAVTATVTGPKIQSPEGLAFSPDGKRLYVASSSQNAVLVFSPDTNQVVKDIPSGGKSPMRMLSRPMAARSTWPTTSRSPSASSTRPPTSSRPRSRSASSLAAWRSQRTGRRCWWSMSPTTRSRSWTPRDHEATGPIGLGHAPQRIVFAPDGQIAYATSRASASVRLVDMRNDRRRTHTKSIPVGAQPNGIALNADGTILYVANDADNSITVVDLRLLETLRSVPTGRYPDGIAFRR